MLRAIQEIKPRFVIAENVFGITNIDGGLVFEQVCLDLEAEGYEVQPFIIPACAKNAPHRRDRCWFVAYSSCNANGLRTKRWLDMDGKLLERRKRKETTNRFNDISKNGNVTNSDSGELEGAKKVGWDGINVERESQFGFATNTNGNGFYQRNGNDEVNPSKGRFDAQCNIESIYNEEPIIEHTNGIGQERRMHEDESKTTIRKQFSERNARSIGTPSWDNFPTQSPICGGDDGIPDKLDGITFSKWRAESIKGYGNAIVPQVAYEIFKVLQHIDDSLK